MEGTCSRAGLLQRHSHCAPGYYRSPKLCSHLLTQTGQPFAVAKQLSNQEFLDDLRSSLLQVLRYNVQLEVAPNLPACQIGY